MSRDARGGRLRPLRLGTAAAVLCLASTGMAQTDEQRAYLEMAATVYTAYVTCPGGLSPDPTEAVAVLGISQGIDPADVAPGGRHHALFQTMILRLAGSMKGKAPPEACAMLADRYPKLIRPAAR